MASSYAESVVDTLLSLKPVLRITPLLGEMSIAILPLSIKLFVGVNLLKVFSGVGECSRRPVMLPASKCQSQTLRRRNTC